MGTPEIRAIRRSPFVIVRTFVVVEFVALAVFFVAAYFIYFKRLWVNLPLDDFLPFETAELIFVIVAQAALLFGIFLDWQFNVIRLRQGHVVWSRGLLFRKHTSVALPQIASVTSEHDPIGRLFGYGTVTLHGQGTQKDIVLRDLQDPGYIVRTIVDLQQVPHTSGMIPDLPPLERLLTEPENDSVEFKSSFRWDTRQNKVNRSLENAAIKTVAAFLNGRGGHLVLGVRDDRLPVGLAADIASIQRSDEDGFEIHFTNVFNTAVGARFRHLVRVSWHGEGSHRVCIVSVAPSHAPVYAKAGNGQEEFFIRSGNSTASLSFSEAAAYIANRFGTATELS